jgi:hypothetical protein
MEEEGKGGEYIQVLSPPISSHFPFSTYPSARTGGIVLHASQVILLSFFLPFTLLFLPIFSFSVLQIAQSTQVDGCWKMNSKRRDAVKIVS